MSLEKKVDSSNNCFVIMPISDPDNYDNGHFSRVYNFIIKPACKKSNITPIRADDIKNTNYIIVDILQRIIKSKLVICDLSSRNPNVLYELGIRQAFNLPVVLIKDKKTERIFDIQGLRTLDYDGSLRVDSVEKDVVNLCNVIDSTLNSDHNNINSLIQLLGVNKAEIKYDNNISPDTSKILNAISDLYQRFSSIEGNIASRNDPEFNLVRKDYILPNGETVKVGDEIFSHIGKNVDSIGRLDKVDENGVWIIGHGGLGHIIKPDEKKYKFLTALPF